MRKPRKHRAGAQAKPGRRVSRTNPAPRAEAQDLTAHAFIEAQQNIAREAAYLANRLDAIMYGIDTLFT